ncbi:hypothetical protein B0H10DRAFT_1721326, partial [Mycena sp. CBHHK59/15]
TDCCCRKALFYQPNFVNQKSALKELVEDHGHICDFYPKFHPELNFISTGAVKYRYRDLPASSNINEMRANVIKCLSSRYAGLITCICPPPALPSIACPMRTPTGPAWADRRYHGHRTLPPDMIAKAR